MELDLTPRTPREWHSYLRRVPRANWLQSLPFVRAAAVVDRQGTRFAVVRDQGEEVGIAAFQELKIGPFHYICLHRGPLWFADEPKPEYLEQFATCLAKHFPKRILRKRRWLPEWPANQANRENLRRLGFAPNQQTFTTIWLDLTPPLDTLRARLEGKWRNRLKHSENKGLKVTADVKGTTATMFLAQYELDRKQKKYHGRSKTFLQEEIAAAMKLGEAFILWASDEDFAPVAAVLIVQHGQSATYRVSWTTEAGRATSAHNLLLWEAVKLLKQRGIKFFDLGGIEPTGAQGLSAFKEGMGGELVELLGVFR